MTALTRLTSSPSRVALACLLQALLVAFAVWPQLSARATGEDYLLAVQPVDPIDPFRGAYVTLDYPGLVPPDFDDVQTGTVHVPLRPVEGTDLWRGGPAQEAVPDDGPYLRCEFEGGPLRCGIESLFASQDEARRLEREIADGAVARVRVDRRGNAAVLEVLPAP